MTTRSLRAGDPIVLVRKLAQEAETESCDDWGPRSLMIDQNARSAQGNETCDCQRSCFR